MDGVKVFAASFFANIASLLFPIRNDIFGLIMLFTLNFVIGLLADLSNRREWSFKKAFQLFRDAAIYFVLVASIYLLGHIKGEDATAVQCVSFLIYIAIYFYGTNILRNARMITQHGSTLFRILDFLYYVLSLRIMEHFSYLKGYVNEYEKENKTVL
ncbi:MAG: hypothetical protein IKJ31_05815 [Bacteroidaceae bacterium]|nr:hypothetical protein [Bacteroidaceae bacterium]